MSGPTPTPRQPSPQPHQRGRSPRFKLIAPSASAEEAAAIVAALERFMRETAPPPSAPERAGPSGRWLRTAMLEAVQRERQGDWGDLREPWINP